MIANDIMTENPMTADDRMTIGEALELFQTLEVRHLPVVNPAGELIGMLSDRDLRNSNIPYTLQKSLEPEARRTDAIRLVDVMSSDVVSVTTEADVDEIIDLMLEHRVGALPVIEPSTGELVGIVSYVDVLRGLRGAAS